MVYWGMGSYMESLYFEFVSAKERKIRDFLGLDYLVTPSVYDIGSITVVSHVDDFLFFDVMWINPFDGLGCA